MVDALHAWVENHGQLPRSSEWKHGTPDHPPHSMVTGVFGRWNNLIQAAGYTPFKSGQRPWTKDDIAAAMLDEVLSTGKWPVGNNWKYRRVEGRPCYETVIRHFGSWDAAKRYAGWTGERSTHADARCVECETEIANQTIGCKTCSDRAGRRRLRAAQRKAEPAASTLARAATGSDQRRVA